MKRSELKELIKECLIEILTESGSGNHQVRSHAPPRQHVSEANLRRSTANLIQPARPQQQQRPRPQQLASNQIPMFDSSPETAYPSFANDKPRSQQQSSKDPYSMAPGYMESVAAQGDAASIAALSVDPSALFGGDIGKLAGV